VWAWVRAGVRGILSRHAGLTNRARGLWYCLEREGERERWANRARDLWYCLDRRVGKCFVHGRRVMRAFGGVSQTLRGMRSARHLLSFKSALQGWTLLRDIGVLGIFRNASVTAQTFAGLSPARPHPSDT